MPSDHLIRADKHDQWVSEGRFSLYDNTTAAFFIVRVDKLVPMDSGIYWCGVDVSLLPDHISVIKLNVTRGTVFHVTVSQDHDINCYTWPSVMHIIFKFYITKSDFWLNGYFHS